MLGLHWIFFKGLRLAIGAFYSFGSFMNFAAAQNSEATDRNRALWATLYLPTGRHTICNTS